MNLFCFTLEGSTESIYEPAYSQTQKEVLPKCQCSPALLRCKPERGRSDPCDSDPPQTAIKLKGISKRSCVPTSLLDNETLEKDINHSCWVSLGDKKDLSHQKKIQNRETCESPCQSNQLTRGDKVKEVNSDRTQTHQAAQAGESAADTAESIQTKRRPRKLQSLVQTKKGHQGGARKEENTCEDNDHMSDVLGNSNPMLTCISLGKRTQKSSCTAPSPQQQQQAKGHEDLEEDDSCSPTVGNPLWSPFECPQPWSSFYHTCHQAPHKRWICSSTTSLPRTKEWDRFESLIQELDNKQPSLSPPPLTRSITHLHLPQGPLTRFQRFDILGHSPLMKPQDRGSCLNGDPTKSRLQGEQMETSSQSDGKHVKASPQRALTAIINGDTQKNEAWKKDAGDRQPFIEGKRKSSNSLESLYSLNSRQSSSSGVTSGSDCSSNRGSLRLEDDLLLTRHYWGKARVHTDHVPSPYDTESLKLKVGDVIDIISKPPMGIWTGQLNGRIGNFKFIYVDVLTEESPETYEETQTPKVRHKSTVKEVLRRLSLEAYSSSLLLNGYQTVEDLMRLREHHLMELNMTDPEHRHRLLAAVESLQQLSFDSQLENEANQEAETPGKKTKADMNNCSRDSGCPDHNADDSDLDFPSEQLLSSEMTTS